MTTYTNPYSGQTVTWGGGGNWTTTAEGALLIHVPLGSPLFIQGWTPAWNPTTRRNGAVKNAPGNREMSQYGIDGRMSQTGLLNLPTIILDAGDTLVIAKSHGDGPPQVMWSCLPYHGADSRSVIEYMTLIVATNYDPTLDAITPSLTPPGIGNNSAARDLRGAMFPESAIDLTKLPTTVNLATIGTWAPGVTAPTIAALTDIFEHFCGELFSSESTDTGTPGFQHPGYGSYLNGYVSNGLVLLCSSLTTAQKLPLARAMVQWGLHLIGAFADGRVTYTSAGGHCLGRKALVVLAGHLLGIEAFWNPNSLFESTGATLPFTEDHRWYLPQNWWFNNGSATDFRAGWRWRGHDPANPMTNGSLAATYPSVQNWGTIGQNGSWAWALQGYYWHSTGSAIGTALAMYLMGRTKEWSYGNFQAVRDFMHGPPAAANTAMELIGVDIPWGEDYGAGPHVPHFCDKAFAEFGPD